MKVDWDLSLAAHGESLEHVPQRFLISRGVEEKWPHYWVIFPQCTLAFSFFGGDFWRPRGLEGRSQPSAGSWPSWLHLVLLYLSSIFFGPWDVCHGNSPQRAVGGLTHAVLCISQLSRDEGKSLPMIPNPWWGDFSISASGPPWAPCPSAPSSLPPSSPKQGIPKLKQFFFWTS